MKNKIAIWAPLRYANYGDDLQAIVFAYYLQSLNYQVIVFQLDNELANIYKLEVANTVDELCKDVNLCLIAGGALLTPFSLVHRMLGKSAKEYERDFRDLYDAGKKYGTKFCAISMGGDGKKRNPYLWYSFGRIKFFKSPYFLNGTVRLKGDVAQMEKFGKTFKYYPDCLLQSASFLEVNKDNLSCSERIFKIAFNLKKKYTSKKFINELFAFAKANRNYHFYFVTTHLESKGINYEYIPGKMVDNIKIEKYKTPTQMLEFMSEIDLLITSKLHLGITGLTVNTPFLSYRGPGKAKSFLQSIGGKWAILNDDITFEEIVQSYFPKSKKELFGQFSEREMEKILAESLNQFLFCKQIVESVS